MDITFTPDRAPESQQDLKRIPPSARVDHEQIKQAIVTYEKARDDELAKRRDAIAAEQALPEAEHADALALAQAQMADRKDPGPKHRTKALDAIAETRRQHAASLLVLADAIRDVSKAFAEHADSWQASLEAERDKLREAMGELLTGWERLWHALQVNTSCRAIGKGTTVPPSAFVSSFRAPRVRDGNVVEVADVLAGLRDLAKPMPPKTNVVENKPIGHTPPSRQPYSGMGSQAVALGAHRDPDKVREWVEQDEADARTRGAAMSDSRRQERLARADQRHAEREAQREADNEAAALDGGR